MRRIGLAALLCLGAARGEEATVGVVRAERRELTRSVSIPATLLPYEEATLVAHVTGYVREVPVREGARVKRGDLLLAIDLPLLAEDTARAQAAVREAEAARAAAEAQAAVAAADVRTREAAVVRAKADAQLRRLQLARTKALHGERAATGEQVESAEGESAVAEANLLAAEASVGAAQAVAQAAAAAIRREEAAVASAKADASRLDALARLSRIGCPYDEALVTARHVDPGVLVRADTTPLVTLMNVARLRAVMNLDERDAVRVGPGTPVDLSPAALPGFVRHSALARVAGAIDPSTRTMRIEADLDDANGALRPGMFVVAGVTVFRRPEAIVLPARCLLGDGKSVYVVRDGVARRQMVRVGVDDGVVVEIEEGVSAGEEVVVTGKEGLADGAKVAVRAEKGP
jgi:multidrug efflux pump subunit AcrA (membrane-fusion protein)